MNFLFISVNITDCSGEILFKLLSRLEFLSILSLLFEISVGARHCFFRATVYVRLDHRFLTSATSIATERLQMTVYEYKHEKSNIEIPFEPRLRVLTMKRNVRRVYVAMEIPKN